MTMSNAELLPNKTCLFQFMTAESQRQEVTEMEDELCVNTTHTHTDECGQLERQTLDSGERVVENRLSRRFVCE